MRLGRRIEEERLQGNRERRQAAGLPWLVYMAGEYNLGQAIADAEEETGEDVKLGVWRNRELPADAVVIGKFIAEADEPELPLYVMAGKAGGAARRQHAEARAQARHQNPTRSEVRHQQPDRARRASGSDKVATDLARRVGDLDQRISLNRWLVAFAVGWLGALTVLCAWLAYVLYTRDTVVYPFAS